MIISLFVRTHEPSNIHGMQSHPVDASWYQERLMLRVINANINAEAENPNYFWNYARTGAPKNTDPCSWRGVTCTDGVAHRFVFANTSYTTTTEHGYYTSKRTIWSVDMDWLPSTMHEVHLRDITLVDGWDAACLPRALRYLSLESCCLRRYLSLHRKVNLRRLPERMEVLLIESGWLRGQIILDNLPRAMRIIRIVHHSISNVYVDSANLPETIEHVAVSGSHLTKLKEISHAKTDSRVHVGKRFVDVESPLKRDFDLLLQVFYMESINEIAQ